mmetsp:Transcript_9464/g.16096  ORF Transcript_9464/g.16096 Transcript_9464/m.16096 type:complete len:86 (+) Transcript_9464:535-792(+)
MTMQHTKQVTQQKGMQSIVAATARRIERYEGFRGRPFQLAAIRGEREKECSEADEFVATRVGHEPSEQLWDRCPHLHFLICQCPP